MKNGGERPDKGRERYLRRIRKIREPYPERAIVYTDETWLSQGHRAKKEWVDLETLKEKNLRSLRLSGLTVGCTKEMAGKGRRLIISDAMTESGPARGALWMFKADGKRKKRKKIESKSKELSGEKKRGKLVSESTEKKEDTVDGGENDSEIAEGIPFEEDYHDSTDGESYKCYFEKSICQNIPKHSVIVIDNAPCHSKKMNYPTSKWRKQRLLISLKKRTLHSRIRR